MRLKYVKTIENEVFMLSIHANMSKSGEYLEIIEFKCIKYQDFKAANHQKMFKTGSTSKTDQFML